MFKSYINPAENKEARRKLPKLMVEGLLLGGTGLGVLGAYLRNRRRRI